MALACAHPRLFDAALLSTGDASRRFGETARQAADRIRAGREALAHGNG